MLKLKKINIDSEHELTEKYGIRSIPTLIFLKDGKEASKISGNQSKTKITEMINEVLGS